LKGKRWKEEAIRKETAKRKEKQVRKMSANRNTSGALAKLVSINVRLVTI
jgi:hypothetical protein